MHLSLRILFLASLNEQFKHEVSITEKEHALRLFTDRITERRLFASYVNEDPAPGTILFFHGDGGNGKSLLLQTLKEHYCHRLPEDSWEYIRDMDDDAGFTEQYENATEATKLPYAYLDFATSASQRDENPRIDLDGLVLIRKQLGRYGLRFPLFDWAFLKYQIKGLGITPTNLKNPFPTDEMTFSNSLIELLYENKYTGKITGVFSLFNKHAGADWVLYCKKRGLDESQWEKLNSLDPKTELYEQLPSMLAQDINSAMFMENAPKRVVLFFDTHEAFWHKDKDRESVDSFFQKDEWLRKFLRELDRENGIINVIAGRELPRWANAPKFPIPFEYNTVNSITGLQEIKQCIHMHEVGTLTRADAEEYLNKAGVGLQDPALQQKIIDFAEANENLIDQVHPFYLGLCADIVLTAERNGEVISADKFAASSDHQNKSRLLVNRLLTYCIPAVQNAVINMAAARFFDEELFCTLNSKLNSSLANVDAYNELIDFSFIKKSKDINNKDWCSIHSLLRSLLRKLEPDKTAKANAALEAFYRERIVEGDSFAIIDAIYHANRQDWERGHEEWLLVFNAARERSQYALCVALSALVPELSLETDFATGQSTYLQAELNCLLARYDYASMNYYQAIEAYNRALLLAPDYINALNNRGTALQGLADLQARLSKTDAAQDSYTQAIASYDRALVLAPVDIYALNNRGNALARLADLQASLSKTDAAQDS